MEASSSGSFSNSRFTHPLADNALLSQFNNVINNSPALLFSNDYMSNLETNLNLPGAFPVIQQEKIMYKSSGISSSAIMKALSNQNAIAGYKGFRKHMEPEIIFRWEFTIPDQKNGVIYYLSDSS